MRRMEVRESQKTINEYVSKGVMSGVGGGSGNSISEISSNGNGNTPSPLSPTNSVGSQVNLI